MWGTWVELEGVGDAEGIDLCAWLRSSEGPAVSKPRVCKKRDLGCDDRDCDDRNCDGLPDDDRRLAFLGRLGQLITRNQRDISIAGAVLRPELKIEHVNGRLVI